MKRFFRETTIERFTVDREEITAAIQRVAILSDERSRTVKLALGKGTLEITASHSDLGEAHETMEVDYRQRRSPGRI